MTQRPTHSLNILNSKGVSLKTSIDDWPRSIAQRLGLEHDHVDGRYDPDRGWQVVTLHHGKTIYIDCDEKASVAHLVK